MYPIKPNPNNPAPAAPKPVGAERKEQLTNYASDKQGLMGEAVRAIVKKEKTMRDILEEMDR